MERNKIIAVAVLAIGIVAWRMGAMEQESGKKRDAGEMSKNIGGARSTKRQRLQGAHEEDIPVGMIRVILSYDKVLDVPINQARLFDYFNAMLSSEFREEHVRAVNLPEISSGLFQELLKDLDWVEGVRAQQQANETEQQAARRRIVQTMPAVAFDRDALEVLIAQLQAADYLQQASLIELYAHQIADMIISAESMRLLSQSDKEYSDFIIALITALPSHLALHILKSMPRAGIWLEQYTIAHDDGLVDSVAISADGNRVVTGSQDSTAKIVAWNGNAWIEDHTIRHADIVTSVAISADGNRVVTGSDDNTAKIVAWNGNAWVEQDTIRHAGMVHSVAISADGNRVVTGSQDNTAKIVAWNGNAWIEQYTIPHNHSVESVSISADGNRVVTGSQDYKAKIVVWNGNAWIEQHTIRHNGVVRSVAISADGNKVVTGSGDDRAKIVAWNGNAWIEQHTIRHTIGVNSVAISADGNRVVTGSDDNTAKIVAWNGNAWIEQHTIRDTIGVRSVAISAEGNRVVTGSWDGTARIVVWNGNAWVEQHTIPHNDSVVSVAISADGNRVVTGSWDDTAKIVGVGFLPTSLPGISDFNALLFEHLLLWARDKKQKISKMDWINNILNMIQWQKLRREDQAELQKLIRETMQ